MACGPTPREAEEKGHLPGYVSVTSKKEERRDTWSESNKSVQGKRHSHRQQKPPTPPEVLMFAHKSVKVKEVDGVFFIKVDYKM